MCWDRLCWCWADMATRSARSHGGERDDGEDHHKEADDDEPDHADAPPVAPVVHLGAAFAQRGNDLVDARLRVHDAARDLARKAEALHEARTEREVDHLANSPDEEPEAGGLASHDDLVD